MAGFQEVIPKGLGRMVHLIIEEFQSIQLSFSFLVSFNMLRMKGDG